MSAVVSVENVSKKFCRGLQRGMLYTTTDVARDMIGLRGPNDRLRPEEFWATKDLSFELNRGESLGLLGTNGAGKSTLLKMLNGIIRPDLGEIRMRGRIGALIEVGAGFHPMLTGRENIYVNGAILGMKKRELDAKFDDIVSFSGLAGDILDAPVKTYSSGMYVRLGFSVAIHCDPEILLVDEVLSVGDGAFRVRCADWIAGFLRRQGTLILVSHYLPTIRECCNKAIYMEYGQCKYYGDTMGGLQMYQDAQNRSMAANNGQQSKLKAGSPLQFRSLKLQDADTGFVSEEFDHEQPFCVKMEIEARETTAGAHLHLVFPGPDGKTVCGWTSRTEQPEGLCFTPGTHELQIDMGPMNLIPGSYSVIGFLSEKSHLADYHEFVGPHFNVRTHPTVDDRFGSMMLKGSLHVC